MRATLVEGKELYLRFSPFSFPEGRHFPAFFVVYRRFPSGEGGGAPPFSSARSSDSLVRSLIRWLAIAPFMSECE